MNMAWPLALALAVGATCALRFQISDLRLLKRSKIQTPRGHSQFQLIVLVVGLLVAGCAAPVRPGRLALARRLGWRGLRRGGHGAGARAARTPLGALRPGVLALLLALGGAGLAAGRARRSSCQYHALPVAIRRRGGSINAAELCGGRAYGADAGRLGMFLAHPLTGVGPGNYTLAYPDFAVGTWYASRGHAHNYYIHMSGRDRLLGALAYLALLAGVILQAIATLRAENRTIWRSAAIGCCGIIAAVAGHDLFENLHVLSMGIQLAAVWGLLSCIGEACGKVIR